MIIPFPEKLEPPTRDWILEHVNWLWGFKLELFQLDILEQLLCGGMYSIMLPTDHGKSTLIEMSVVLSLIREPNRPNIVVKVSDEAATATLKTIAWQLITAAERYPEVKPLLRWSKQKEEPEVGKGFYVQGGDHKNRNPSVFAGSIGSRDLQGRRGRFHCDDVETANEAQSAAYQKLLEARVSATLRTLEPRPDRLWSLFGTPYHTASIYFTIIDKLHDVGQQYKVIRRPWVDPETHQLLWPARADKIEIHRRTMSPLEWQVAYELKPMDYGKLDPLAIDAVFDNAFPICETEGKAREFLVERFAGRQDAGKMAMLSARWYIGYDPAARGEFAIVAAAVCQDRLFIFQSYMQAGDIFDQIRILTDLHARFPAATMIIEKDGQQEAYIDVIRGKLPNALIVAHQTKHIKDSDQIGIPSMLEFVRGRRFHMPQDLMFRPIYEELRQWPGGHPHLLPAIWFCSHYDRRSSVIQSLPETTVSQPRPAFTRVAVTPAIRARVDAAWNRSWRN
jgi:hypothetical protein